MSPHKDRKVRLAYLKDYRTKNRDKHIAGNRDAAYRRKYGISTEQYEKMLAAQGGVCFLCGKPPKRKRLHVDHNHDSGVARKLLCASCNRGLAYLEHATWFSKARAYLATYV